MTLHHDIIVSGLALAMAAAGCSAGGAPGRPTEGVALLSPSSDVFNSGPVEVLISIG